MCIGDWNCPWFWENCCDRVETITPFSLHCYHGHVIQWMTCKMKKKTYRWFFLKLVNIKIAFQTRRKSEGRNLHLHLLLLLFLFSIGNTLAPFVHLNSWIRWHLFKEKKQRNARILVFFFAEQRRKNVYCYIADIIHSLIFSYIQLLRMINRKYTNVQIY